MWSPQSELVEDETQRALTYKTAPPARGGELIGVG